MTKRGAVMIKNLSGFIQIFADLAAISVISVMGDRVSMICLLMDCWQDEKTHLCQAGCFLLLI